MPSKLDGPLDNGELEDVALYSSKWMPIRASRWSVDLVRPEFLALRSRGPKKPMRRTAWLDGLRGFAALMVYIQHNQLWAHNLQGNLIFENAFGYEGRRYFAALPFIRHFFSGGHFAVAIFFVISGYVLSIKSLDLIQKGHYQTAADSIGSALFRRWVRLYFPVICITLLFLSYRHWSQIWVDVAELKPTYREELKNWYYSFKNYSFVFSESIYEFSNSYQPHAWSIPIEFKGSIIVYTTTSALARCTRNARLCCEVGLIVYFLYVVDGWYGALFVSGMLLSDLDLLALAGQQPKIFTTLEGFKELIFFHLFIVALYLGGVPSVDSPDSEHLLSKSPGWRWLSHLKPQAVFNPKWFYLFWAAVLTVASVPRLPWLKGFFETRFCQYLARISFALYLVHGPVIWILGDRVYAAVGFARDVQKDHISNWIGAFPLSTQGPMGLELAFWASQIVILPVTLYAAEVATKLFDEPSVKISNWLYKKTLQPSLPQTPLRNA
ncbi:hypothetical protein BU24DRAFT_476590 [Aaosphaeria arxii CBS 175.79]|uniref:Acyltransferase 3 domain-containing protein n=1 Tax=Aaosphaeria arxii CBS 175.79 TaxID=1450172 RepID=A0A6A5Y1S2_9PLEO|nr:uncharacterized protein BU24DRAFT_476590 [Aaosphaeria arxii CBS 175.79]KAF2019515.1 hypothetical protein BU24DRAFT_476590 [Aaosphaeria arxii CBS 175.79]